MKAFIVAIVFIGGLLIACGPTLLVNVTTTPQGADISVDGKSVGKSPWTGRVARYYHSIELSMGGMEPATFEILDETEDTITFDHKFQMEYGQVNLRSNLSLSPAVTLNGNDKVGLVTSFRRPAGTYAATFVLIGYEPIKRSIVLSSGETQSVDLSFTPLDDKRLEQLWNLKRYDVLIELVNLGAIKLDREIHGDELSVLAAKAGVKELVSAVYQRDTTLFSDGRVLYHAIKAGHMDLALHLIESGVSPLPLIEDSDGPEGYIKLSPLYLALLLDKSSIVTAMLDAARPLLDIVAAVDNSENELKYSDISVDYYSKSFEIWESYCATLQSSEMQYADEPQMSFSTYTIDVEDNGWFKNEGSDKLTFSISPMTLSNEQNSFAGSMPSGTELSVQIRNARGMEQALDVYTSSVSSGTTQFFEGTVPFDFFDENGSYTLEFMYKNIDNLIYRHLFTLYVTKNEQYAERAKPVIYLYPSVPSDISVRVEPEGGVTKSDPPYVSGWHVRATPEGELLDIGSNRVYPYLFWESRDAAPVRLTEGFTVAQSDLPGFFEEKLKILGLNDREVADFSEFWIPIMNSYPFYLVKFHDTEYMDRVAPLVVIPRPDTVIRVYMEFEGLSGNVSYPLQKLTKAPNRTGFVVIEWGGRRF